MKLIKMPAVCERAGLRQSKLYDLMSKGQFPRPVKIGSKSTAWPENEVDAWIEERIAERDRRASVRR